MTSFGFGIDGAPASRGRPAADLPATAPFRWAAAPLQVIWGEAAETALVAPLQGFQRLLWVSGRRAGASASAIRLRARFADRIADAIDDVPSHSSEAVVCAATTRARAAEIDGLLAYGGGSASDTAKAVAIMMAEGGELVDHANVFYPPDRYEQKVLSARKLPIFVVPTTASAAEVTPGLGIRAGHGHKMVFWDPNVVPRVIVLDAAGAAETPVAAFLATGMNALAHCIEAHYSKVRNPVSSALALHGIRILGGALPAVAADPGDPRARGEAMLGAHLSGQAIANARVGLHHAICHGLGSLGGLSHGDANAIMLPHVVAFNARAAAPALRDVAEALGAPVAHLSDAGAAAAAVEALRVLQAAIGCPTRLRNTGYDPARTPRIAAGTMSDRGTWFNPVLVDGRADVAALIEAAW